MPEWTFLAAKSDGLDVKYGPLSSDQSDRLTLYKQVLEEAHRSSVPSPIFSNYYVRAAVGSNSDNISHAGNIEYGLCQALHGEESAVAVFAPKHENGSNEPIILAFGGDGFSSCGNCRDIMLDTFGSDFEIVFGPSESGRVGIIHSSALFFDKYSILPERVINGLRTDAMRTLEEGRYLENDAYSPEKIRPERHYYACVAGRYGMYFGAYDGMSEYHPIYALRDAVRQARRNRDSFISNVIIVGTGCKGTPPHVMYKDRQHLFELNQSGELISGNSLNPPIYLVSYSDQIDAICQTTVKEWLPHVFGPHKFGDAFMESLVGYFQALHESRRES